jgi:hypothetical protein
MKQKFKYFLVITTLIFFGCKKDSNSTGSGTKSTWTFNGVTYNVTNGSFESSSNELMASDDASAAGGGNFIRVFFWSATKPTTNATLTVVDYATATTNPTTCSIQVGNIYGANPLQYLSRGTAGDKVTLTVSGGKLTAAFSNITVKDGTNTKTVSGTIVEN